MYIITYSLVEMQPRCFVMRNEQVKSVYCLLFVCVPQSHVPESSRSHQQQQLHSHTQGVRESILKLSAQISPCMSHPKYEDGKKSRWRVKSALNVVSLGELKWLLVYTTFICGVLLLLIDSATV